MEADPLLIAGLLLAALGTLALFFLYVGPVVFVTVVVGMVLSAGLIRM